jgi:hypothetical protein
MTGPMTIAEQFDIEQGYATLLTEMLNYARGRQLWHGTSGHVFAARRYRRISDALSAAVVEMRPEP